MFDITRLVTFAGLVVLLGWYLHNKEFFRHGKEFFRYGKILVRYWLREITRNRMPTAPPKPKKVEEEEPAYIRGLQASRKMEETFRDLKAELKKCPYEVVPEKVVHPEQVTKEHVGQFVMVNMTLPNQSPQALIRVLLKKSNEPEGMHEVQAGSGYISYWKDVRPLPQQPNVRPEDFLEMIEVSHSQKGDWYPRKLLRVEYDQNALPFFKYICQQPEGTAETVWLNVRPLQAEETNAPEQVTKEHIGQFVMVTTTNPGQGPQKLIRVLLEESHGPESMHKVQAASGYTSYWKDVSPLPQQPDVRPEDLLEMIEVSVDDDWCPRKLLRVEYTQHTLPRHRFKYICESLGIGEVSWLNARPLQAEETKPEVADGPPEAEKEAEAEVKSSEAEPESYKVGDWVDARREDCYDYTWHRRKLTKIDPYSDHKYLCQSPDSKKSSANWTEIRPADSQTPPPRCPKCDKLSGCNQDCHMCMGSGYVRADHPNYPMFQHIGETIEVMNGGPWVQRKLLAVTDHETHPFKCEKGDDIVGVCNWSMARPVDEQEEPPVTEKPVDEDLVTEEHVGQIVLVRNPSSAAPVDREWQKRELVSVRNGKSYDSSTYGRRPYVCKHISAATAMNATHLWAEAKPVNKPVGSEHIGKWIDVRGCGYRKGWWHRRLLIGIDADLSNKSLFDCQHPDGGSTGLWSESRVPTKHPNQGPEMCPRCKGHWTDVSCSYCENTGWLPTNTPHGMRDRVPTQANIGQDIEVFVSHSLPNSPSSWEPRKLRQINTEGDFVCDGLDGKSLYIHSLGRTIST